jgi:hypothetical protein
MSLYDNGLAAVKAIIGGITDLGVLHDYPRFTAQRDVLLDFFQYTEASGATTMRGWWLESPAEANGAGLGGRHRRRLSLRLVGIMALDDDRASYKFFRNLAETVVRTLEEKRLTMQSYLGANAMYDSEGELRGNTGWPSIVSFEDGMFAGVLCHVCTIEMAVVLPEQTVYG